MYKGVFSEFEVNEQYFYFDDEDEPIEVSCIGKADAELDVRTVIKNCRGVPERRRTRGKGTGTMNETLHVPHKVYLKQYGMGKDETMKQGVHGYGKNNLHPEFKVTQKIEDEDGEIKYRCYPRVVLGTGPKPSTENGAEEVKEIDVAYDLLPDSHGYCMYEALAKDIDEADAKKWMKGWSEDLVYETAEA